MATEFSMLSIDARGNRGLDHSLEQLRRKLSPQGDVVSEQGRQRTLAVFGEPLTPQQVVSRICQDVREQGLEAVLDYCWRLDNAAVHAESLRVSAEQLAEAHAGAEPGFLESVRRIRQNLRAFQEAILHRDVEFTREPGITLRQRYVPLRRVGLCVPGGAAAYPSTVLMTAVPAQAAGVRELAVVAPPTPFGANNPDLLATCHELGIEEVYRVGGAQAVAALAYGVAGLPAVDKIVGPGNLFVALAKKSVYGIVDIDSIAGPSEVVVIADRSTPPQFAAADLLAQAEHAPGSAIVVSWEEEVLAAIHRELAVQAARLERAEWTLESLRDFGALVQVSDREQAAEVTNLLAPEHLHIACEDPETLLAAITNAGATFLGPYSPVAMGDYVAGPSHVLPTGGTARWASGLSANDFLRAGSVINYSRAGFLSDAPDACALADKEGLTAHRRSVTVRQG